ncbi:MAG: HIRAN domain-containing protein [Thiohalocapsa sp.]|nr:HIRAN domain-containing protein [Thiohalocapsa sp.]MCF7989885.1 HIRAN domain-containing protein [Thiohalocapsa sp.]
MSSTTADCESACRADAALGRRITLQRTRLVGFRHHDAPGVWPALVRSARLTLEREPDNPHDPDAVALRWRGRKLGYLPRGENLVVARLLDRKRNLSARIDALTQDAACNARIRLEILMH